MQTLVELSHHNKNSAKDRALWIPKIIALSIVKGNIFSVKNRGTLKGRLVDLPHRQTLRPTVQHHQE